MIKSKKLSSLVAASLILAGGSLLGVQTVSAQVTDQQFNEVVQGVNANTQKISQIENQVNASKDYSSDIATNKTDIATNKDNIAVNKKAIADEATARDQAVAQERAERKGADAAQDKVIQQVNQNVADGFDTINKNIGIITDQLNKNDLAEQQARDAADKAEAKARDAADKNLQANINNEAKLRDEADQNLQNNLNKAVNAQAGFNKAQAGINDTLTKAVTNNSKAIVANAEAAKNLEKHLKETDGRVDKANAEIHTNAGNIAQNKDNIAANKKAIGDEAAARESGDNALQSQIKKESAARQADISRLDNKIHDVSKEVDTVGALSMAMSGLHPLSYDEGDARFQLSAAVGTYDGTEALALGGFYHFNRDSMLSVGVATDLGADEHRMGANVGYTRRIGQGGHVSRPSEGTVSDIMKDIKNLEQKQAKLEQENEQLKKQLASLKK